MTPGRTGGRSAAAAARPEAGARAPRWVAVPATLAPLVLIGGWTLAAALQPAGYDSVRDTISALAARGTPDRLVMTFALLLLGLCHLGTAAGLRDVRPRGRGALALGGVATIAVAAFPQPAGGDSAAHATAATVAFAALALWPALGTGDIGPAPVRPRAGRSASVVLGLLCVLFAVTLSGGRVGLTERVLAGAEALWPLAVAVGVLAARRASAARVAHP